MHGEATETEGGRRQRSVAAVAGLFGFVTVAGALYGIAATDGIVPGGSQALIVGPALLYGLVMLAASWSGRGGHGMFVLTTLLGLGVAMVVTGPLGVSVLDPIKWGVLVGSLSVFVGLPSVLLVYLEAHTVDDHTGTVAA